MKYNWEFGPLGFPKTDILTNVASGIEWQEYEHGFIVGNKAHGYFISMGVIRDVWVKYNWEFGPLGFPKTDILKEADRECQNYDGGKICYSVNRGSWVELD